MSSVVCPCGTSVQALQWDVIDAESRPDLVDRLVAGDLDGTRCPACGGAILRREPLALLLRAFERPLLLTLHASPDPTLEPSWWRPLNRSLDDGFFAVAHAPFRLARLIVPSSLVLDVADPDEAARRVGRICGADDASAYTSLLERIRRALKDARFRQLRQLLLTETRDLQSLEALLASRPELLSCEFERFIAEGQANEQEMRIGELTRAVVTAARTDVGAAWSELGALKEAVWQAVAPGLEDRARTLDALVNEKRFAEAIEFGETAFLNDRIEGAEALELSFNLGLAHMRIDSADRAGHMDAAAGHFEWVLHDIDSDDTALSLAQPDRDDKLSQLLINLAGVYKERVTGDRRENLERAISYLTRSLNHIDANTEPDRWALAQSNLGLLFQERESGDRLENLEMAREHLARALQVRSTERDLVDWSYAMLNLGVVEQQLAALEGRISEDARSIYEEILTHEESITDPNVLARVHRNLGVSYLRETETADSSYPPEPQNVTAASAHLLKAAEIATDLLIAGQALNQLAELHENLADADHAREYARRAAALLTPTVSLPDCRDANWRLAHLLATDDDWEGAAQAFEVALAAADTRFNSRLSTGDRERELQNSVNLARWTSYAVARAGRLGPALLFLEGGRTREYRRRLPVPDTHGALLQEQSPGLYAQYLEAMDAFAASRLAGDGSDPGVVLQALLQEIRLLPGLDEFGAAANWGSIEAAVEHDYPLLYVNPAPYGTVAFLVSRQVDGVEVRAVFLAVTSRQIVDWTFFGVDGTSGGLRERPISYVNSVGFEPADLSEALAYVLPCIGDSCCAQLEAALSSSACRGVTLVVAGPLASVPLHAASWSAAGRTECLLDRRPVRYAPSATVHAACLERVAGAAEDGLRIVALADPTPQMPLLASRAEVAQVQQHFAVGDRRIAVGPEATRGFLEANAAWATHLHLACHAAGSLYSYQDTRLALADGEVTLSDILGGERLKARLAVASACQTALVDLHAAPEEVYSIGAALLSAGCSAAVASLWPVDDYVTAMLLVGFYERLFGGSGEDPCEALRGAQQWLRGMSEQEERLFLRDHPALLEAHGRRLRENTLPGEHGGHDLVAPARSRLRPYWRPEHWAGFICLGA